MTFTQFHSAFPRDRAVSKELFGRSIKLPRSVWVVRPKRKKSFSVGSRRIMQGFSWGTQTSILSPRVLELNHPQVKLRRPANERDQTRVLSRTANQNPANFRTPRSMVMRDKPARTSDATTKSKNRYASRAAASVSVFRKFVYLK